MKNEFKTKKQLISESTELCKMLSDLERVDGILDNKGIDLPVLQNILNQTNDAIYLINPVTSKFIDVNEKACVDLGYSREELLKLGVIDIEAVLPNNFLWKEHVKEIRNQDGAIIEGKHKRKDGTVFPVEISVRYIHQENSQYMVAVVRDITERKLAEERLRQSEVRFKNLVEMSSDWVWMVGEDGVYTYVSPKVESLLGYTVEEVLGKRPFDFMPADEAERVSTIFGVIFERRESFACMENTNLHKDGRPVVLETSGVPIFDNDGAFRGYRGIDRDITDRIASEIARKQGDSDLKRKGEELEKLSDELHGLTIEMADIEERERKAFAEMLHDVVGQNLASLNLTWGAIYKDISSLNEGQKAQFDQVNFLIKDTIKFTRSLTQELYQQIPDGLTLQDAVITYGNTCLKKFGIKLSFELEDGINYIPKEIKQFLIRFIRESFQNIMKHASAKRVEVFCSVDGGVINAKVVDDGTGFSPKDVDLTKKKSGIGLMLMRERVRNLSGQLHIDSTPGEGTTLSCTLPL